MRRCAAGERSARQSVAPVEHAGAVKPVDARGAPVFSDTCLVNGAHVFGALLTDRALVLSVLRPLELERAVRNVEVLRQALPQVIQRLTVIGSFVDHDMWR